MKVIHDPERLQSLIQQFEIEQMFSLSNEVPFELRSYEEEEIVLQEGDKMNVLLFLVEGRVKVTSSVQTGKVLLLRFCEPFSILGDIELIQKVLVQSQVEATQRTLCIALPFQYIYDHAIQEPNFLMSLLTHVTYKLQTCTTASRVNLLASVENRFASYLLSTMNVQHEFGKEIRTTNTQEIADMIGTTSRHLNRVIFKLSESGVIRREGETLYVVNRNALEELSNGIRYE